MTYLLAVQEHGGIGRAAEALGMTQPALSKAIQRVESHLGLPLFERGPGGMRATHAGRVFIQRAKRIQLEFDDAMKEMRGLRSGEHGLLRIGVFACFQIARCMYLSATKAFSTCKGIQPAHDVIMIGRMFEQAT